MNIFKEIFYSIYNYKYYPQFFKNKLSRVFWTGALVSIIYYFIAILCPFAFQVIKMGGFVNAYKEIVPDFRIENGALVMDETYEYEDSTTLIYIDADCIFYDIYDNPDYLDDYMNVILIDNEKIIVKNIIRFQQLYFSDLGDFGRDDLLFLVRIVGWVAWAIVGMSWMSNMGYFFAGAFVVTLIGLIVAACMNKKLSFDEIFILSVYSRTLPLAIKAFVNVIGIIGIVGPIFQFINFGISTLILILAMKHIENKPQIPYNPYYMNNGNQ